MVHVLEDWADESLYFYEMHMRFTTEGNWQRNLPRMFEYEGWFLKSFLCKYFPGAIRRGIRDITRNQGTGRKSPKQLLIDCERHIKAVDDMLGEDDWLVGNALSLADLAVYGMFQCFRDADMLLDVLQRYPVVVRWMERVEVSTNEASVN
jgi:glutathione S-transferase